MKSEQLAWLIKRHGIEMTHLSHGSHIGSILSVADIEEGKAGEYRDVNSWLFDDSQNAKDAVAVGIVISISILIDKEIPIFVLVNPKS